MMAAVKGIVSVQGLLRGPRVAPAGGRRLRDAAGRPLAASSRPSPLPDLPDPLAPVDDLLGGSGGARTGSSGGDGLLDLLTGGAR